MIIPSQAVKIVVATKPVDFRKGHDGMAAVVRNELGLDPLFGIIVVFRAKRGDRIKILLWGGSGLVMAYTRRKLKEVYDCDGSEIAAGGLRRIAEFYKIEAEIRGASAGQRLSPARPVPNY